MVLWLIRSVSSTDGEISIFLLSSSRLFSATELGNFNYLSFRGPWPCIAFCSFEEATCFFNFVLTALYFLKHCTIQINYVTDIHLEKSVVPFSKCIICQPMYSGSQDCNHLPKIMVEFWLSISFSKNNELQKVLASFSNARTIGSITIT